MGSTGSWDRSEGVGGLRTRSRVPVASACEVVARNGGDRRYSYGGRAVAGSREATGRLDSIRACATEGRKVAAGHWHGHHRRQQHGDAGGRRRGGRSSVRGKERFLLFDWGPLVIEGLTGIDQTVWRSLHHGEDTRQIPSGCAAVVSRARRGLPPHPVALLPL